MPYLTDFYLKISDAILIWAMISGCDAVIEKL